MRRNSQLKKKGGISFIKSSLVYSSSNTIGQVIIFFRDFVIRRILPPEVMGYWNFAKVVEGFISTFDLGCIAGAKRELPIMKGRRNIDEEHKIRSNTFWFTLVQNTIIAIFAILYIWWRRSTYAPLEVMAAYVGSAIFLLMSIQSVYITFFESAQMFVTLSKLLFVGTIIESIAFMLCSYIWGIIGLMSVAIISSCFKVVLFFYAARIAKFRIYLTISINILKKLLSFGFFLRLVDYPGNLFNMINILWVTKFMDINSLALFSMARGFFFQTADMSTRIRSVYAMHILEEFGRGASKNILSKKFKQFLLFQLLIVVPLVCWAVGIVLPFIIRNFIPKYAAANQTLLVLLICCFFYVINSGLSLPWIIEKKLVARGIVNVIALTLMLLSLTIIWFVFKWRTINGIAYATLSGYFFYFVFMVIGVGKSLWGLKECLKIIVVVTMAAIWIFIVLNTGYKYVSECNSFMKDLRATFLMGICTFFSILPVPYMVLKNHSF